MKFVVLGRSAPHDYQMSTVRPSEGGVGPFVRVGFGSFVDFSGVIGDLNESEIRLAWKWCG